MSGLAEIPEASRATSSRVQYPHSGWPATTTSALAGALASAIEDHAHVNAEISHLGLSPRTNQRCQLSSRRQASNLVIRVKIGQIRAEVVHRHNGVAAQFHPNRMSVQFFGQDKL